MANEVAVKFNQLLTDSLIKAEDALPKDFNRERFIQNSISVLNDHPELARISPALLVHGLLKGAYLGLDFMNKECYLIQYGNNISFQTDYKGEVKFTKKYSIRKIRDIYAKVVRDGDEFVEEIKDGHPSLQFRSIPFSNKDIVGAFAVCLFQDGGILYETMSVEDIQSVRNNYSKASQSKAWKNSFDEMCKKTVLRRLCKHIETDFESVEARSAWEDGSGMDFASSAPIGNREEVVDVFEDISGNVEVEDAEQ